MSENSTSQAKVEKSYSSLNETLQSLLFLHHECFLQGEYALADILEKAVESTIALQDTETQMTSDTTEMLYQFSFLSRFKKLSHAGKLKVLETLEN